jgi:quercetin dioxygenase-like cupin family protein
MYYIQFDEMGWDLSESGVRSKRFFDGSTQMRLLEFGRDLDHPNWCEIGHLGYVLEGECEIEFENSIITLRKGDGISIPNGTDRKHRPRAISEKVRMIFFERI